MTIGKARDSIKQARREIADALEQTPRGFLIGRRKHGKLKRALANVDKAAMELRGL